MGLLDKLKSPNPKSIPPTSQSFPPPPPPHSLGPSDVFRYRHQRGVNLGSWFVLERWITSKPFAGAVAPGQSDLDVARGKNAKANLEQLWDSWIGDEDWRWIKEKGYNSVRLPIGFHHLCSPCPDVLRGTDFEPFHDTFSGAWDRIVNAIRKAEQYGLGVLIDLHAVAGGQNNDAHCGNSSGKPKLFSSNTNLRSTALALRFLASFLAPIPHIVGLQLLNEPANNNHIQGWYESTLSDLRGICGPDLPLYVHDAWDTQWYAPWAGRRGDFTVVDHHLYRTFTPEDNALNGDQHAGKLRDSFQHTLAQQSAQASGQLVVAEFSATINPQSIGHMEGGEQDRQRRVFVNAEIELFNRHTAGWWFWTYKLEEPWNAGWSARNASQAEILPGFVGTRFKGSPPPGNKERMLQQAHGQHTHYWQTHGGSPNPASFAPGYSQGWDDALLFLSHASGASVIGFMHQWAIRRKMEFESRHGSLGPPGQEWEWMEGFRQGARACEGVCAQ